MNASSRQPPVADVVLHDVRLKPWTEQQVVAHVLSRLAAAEGPRGGWIVTPNVDILRRISKDADVAALVRRASVMVADGMPLVWAAAVRGTPLPERVTGASLLERLCAGAAEDGRRVYLLGGASGVAETAARKLAERYPGLPAEGWSPPFRPHSSPEDLAEMRTRLAEAGAEIVFCGFGFPKQERIIAQLIADFPDAWFVGCGASVTFAAGQIPRAPAWMQRTGLEWLHRLYREPSRMFRRYLVDDLPFAGRLLFTALAHRLRSKS